MGLKGVEGEEGMKVKKERQQEKSAPVNRTACRFMWCCIIIHQPQEMEKLKQCDAYGFVCVCVRLSASVFHHNFVLRSHVHVSSKAN